MSTTSKSLTSLDVRTTATIAVSTVETSSAVSVNTLVGASVVGKITNPGTFSTNAATFTMQYRYKSAGTLYNIGPFTAGVAVSTAYEFAVSIPDGAYEIVCVFENTDGTYLPTAECHGAGLELSTV